MNRNRTVDRQKKEINQKNRKNKRNKELQMFRMSTTGTIYINHKKIKSKNSGPNQEQTLTGTHNPHAYVTVCILYG